MATVADLGEFGLIARLMESMPSGSGVTIGAADDAAVLQTPDPTLLLAVDMLVEGRHFRQAADPVHLGYKALAVNVSDIAAMGGVPRYALLALSLPPSTELAWVDGLRVGLAEAGAEYNVALVGGDTTAGDGVVLSVTLTGVPGANRVVLRSGARVGDVVCVTNSLGDSYGGLQVADEAEPRRGRGAPGRHGLDARAAQALLVAQQRPRARVAEGIAAARAGVDAMIDISDGLVADLGHICVGSGVGAEVVAANVPMSDELRRVAAQLGFDPLAAALGGGEDYELLMTAPESRLSVLKELVGEAGSSLTEIGRIVSGSGVHLTGAAPPPLPGWDHFRSRESSPA